MANDFVTVTRTLVKRGWSDIEPKIAAALVSGGVADGVVSVATAYGVHIPTNVQTMIPYGLAILAGYLTPSAGTTILKHIDAANGSKIETEQHTGTVESTITAPTKIPSQAAANFIAQLPSSGGPAPTPADNQATKIVPMGEGIVNH